MTLLLLLFAPASSVATPSGTRSGWLGAIAPYTVFGAGAGIVAPVVGGVASSGWAGVVLPFTVLAGWRGVAAGSTGDDGDTAESVSPTRRGLFRGRQSRR